MSIFYFGCHYMEQNSDKKSNQGAQTVVRAVDLLKLIASNESGVRLTDIAHEMQLEKTTAHRLLKTLVSQNLLVMDPRNFKYRLGSLIFELGLVAKIEFDISSICSPILKRLARDTLDTSFLFIRSGNYAVCIAREMGGYYIQTPVIQVGSRQPLGVSAGGLALLLALDQEEAYSIIDNSAMRLDIYGGLTTEQTKNFYQLAKERGIAEIENHAVPGVKGVGVPIYQANNELTAAITVASTIDRMDKRHISEIIPKLRKAAEDIQILLSSHKKP